MTIMQDRSARVNPIIREYHDNNGTLPAFSSIGGYPIYYFDGSDVLCAKCARMIIEAHIADNTLSALAGGIENELDADGCYIGPDPILSAMRDAVGLGADRKLPIASDVHWEGEPLTCEECQAEIESAYGNPDEDEDTEDEDKGEIRRNEHPGKFEGGLLIDEYVHGLSLDGADEEAGDVSEHGEWYGLLRGPLAPVTSGSGLNDAECDYLNNVSGAIVREDDQGFVSVEYFDSEFALDKAWCRIAADFIPDEEDEDTDVIEDSPLMQSGYAYESAADEWESSSDESWETVVYTPHGNETHLGVRRIDGSACNVWDCRDGLARAQVKLG